MAAPNAKMHTPYGATECLPVATIEAAEVLGETAARTDAGAGVCVGRKFDSIEWRVIRISDEPITSIDDAEELPIGEIGELIVRGPQASPRYVTRSERNADAKIIDKRAGASSPPSVWHRMGDVGYLDDQDRFWYCGRKSQRVVTRNGPLFTEQIEAVFNTLPGVRRAALVGVGREEVRLPVIVVEPWDQSVAGHTKSAKRRQSALIVNWHEIEPQLKTLWYAEHGYTPLRAVLFHRQLPVDVRHNSKINREQLAVWAATQLPEMA
jgi:acyl-CoA synthetase (AMP-forming)/AMP-acid ligase II